MMFATASHIQPINSAKKVFKRNLLKLKFMKHMEGHANIRQIPKTGNKKTGGVNK